MKNKTGVLNTILAAVVGAALLAVVLMRTFLPAYIVPGAGISNLVLLSLIALVIDHYAVPGAGRCYICVCLFALITFGVLPLAAGYVTVSDMWKLAARGTAVFTVTTLMYTTIQDRISSGPSGKAAPIISAMGLYFAAQCLQNII